jgi:hypothetical protein
MKLFEIRNEILSMTDGPVKLIFEHMIDHLDGMRETIRIQQAAISRLEQLVPQVRQLQYEIHPDYRTEGSWSSMNQKSSPCASADDPSKPSSG